MSMKKVLFSLALLVSAQVVCNTLDVDVIAQDASITITEQSPVTPAILTPEQIAALTPEQLAAYQAQLAAAQQPSHFHVTVVTRDAAVETTRTEDAKEEATEENVTRSVELTEVVEAQTNNDEVTVS